jgi:hypothetical protein
MEALGKARSVKENCVAIHNPHDEFVPFAASAELCGNSGARLIAAGEDHRLNCEERRKALDGALCLILDEAPN